MISYKPQILRVVTMLISETVGFFTMYPAKIT